MEEIVRKENRTNFMEELMKFVIKPDKDGYFLYANIDGKWKLICFRLTIIGAKLAASRFLKRYKRCGEFELQ